MIGMLRALGIFLLFCAFVWIIYVAGGVFSRTEGFRTVGQMLPGLTFHAICAIGGMSALVQASRRKQAAAETAPARV